MKKVFLLLSMIFLVILLTGCKYTFENHITVNRDYSVDSIIKYTLIKEDKDYKNRTSDLNKQWGREIGYHKERVEILRNDGYAIVEDVTTDEEITLKAKKSFGSLEEFDVRGLDGVGSGLIHISESKFTKADRNGYFDYSLFVDSLTAEEAKVDIDLNIKVFLYLPEEVLNSNATFISEDGKTLIWKINEYNEKIKLEATLIGDVEASLSGKTEVTSLIGSNLNDEIHSDPVDLKRIAKISFSEAYPVIGTESFFRNIKGDYDKLRSPDENLNIVSASLKSFIGNSVYEVHDKTAGNIEKISKFTKSLYEYYQFAKGNYSRGSEIITETDADEVKRREEYVVLKNREYTNRQLRRVTYASKAEEITNLLNDGMPNRVKYFIKNFDNENRDVSFKDLVKRNTESNANDKRESLRVSLEKVSEFMFKYTTKERTKKINDFINGKDFKYIIPTAAGVEE